MTAQPDKTQLGLTDAARDKADDIQRVGGFKDRQDAYRLAIAVALAEGLEPASENVSRRNYVSVGSLDPDNYLRAATKQLRTDHGGRPAALIERLAEAGIDRIHDQLVGEGRPLREILQPYQPSATATTTPASEA